MRVKVGLDTLYFNSEQSLTKGDHYTSIVNVGGCIDAETEFKLASDFSNDQAIVDVPYDSLGDPQYFSRADISSVWGVDKSTGTRAFDTTLQTLFKTIRTPRQCRVILPFRFV